MLFNFLLGGVLFTIIDIVVNRFDNAKLGAIISMVPIGFLSIFIINKKYIDQYVRNIFFVVCVTLIITAIFYISLKFIPINKLAITSSILVIWVFSQFINYKFNIYINEPKIVKINN
jgi:hypothetical protein